MKVSPLLSLALVLLLPQELCTDSCFFRVAFADDAESASSCTAAQHVAEAEDVTVEVVDVSSLLDEATGVAEDSGVLMSEDVVVVDTAVHLNDPSKIPRRGSLALSLLNWLPSNDWVQHYATLAAGSLSFSKSMQLALGGETNMVHILGPQGMKEYGIAAVALSAKDAKQHSANSIVAVESTTFLAPSGQENNVGIHLSEAKWLVSLFNLFASCERHVQL